MRIAVLVDGFNLYHSVKSAERHLGFGARLRWLDLASLCRTLVASSYPPGTAVSGIYYFSALAVHLESRKPDVVRRHRTLLTAFESTGIEVNLARFKKKDNYKRLNEFKIQVAPFRKWFRIPFARIRLWHRSHEEKETDVAIACKLLELLCRDACDSAIIVSGDADLAPAIRTAKVLYPKAPVAVAFPFDRQTQDLERVAARVLRISAHLYQTHQFPDTVVTTKGKRIAKPSTW